MITRDTEPSGSRRPTRMACAAMIIGLTASAALPPTATAAPHPASPAAPAPKALTDPTDPVREIVGRTAYPDGVKGTVINRTESNLTFFTDGTAERRQPWTLLPGQRFTFMVDTYGSNSPLSMWATAPSGDRVWILLADSSDKRWQSVEHPRSDIAGERKRHWRDHQVGDTNRRDLAPFDVTVHREPDGNQGLKGETDETRKWANFDVYIDDHDASIEKSYTQVTNRTEHEVLVRSFRSGSPTSDLIPLAPRQTHEFAFSGTGTIVQVYDPKVSTTDPVGELTYTAATRQKPISVSSTFGVAPASDDTITGEVRLHGDARLDTTESGTYVAWWEKHRPGERRNDTATLLFELHKTSRHTL